MSNLPPIEKEIVSMIRIVVADDHDVVRRGLRSFLEIDPEFSIVGEAANGLEVAPLIEELQPDVLILDMTMPGKTGLEVTQEIMQRWPQTRVIILSMHSDEALVQKALSYGAAGYVIKDSTSADIGRAIRDVVAGRRFLSSPLSERAIEAFMRNAPQVGFDAYTTLTAREQEVLKLAAQGLNNAEIGTQLAISPRTAETHRSRMMHKLGLRTQTELVRYAIKRGILPLDE